MERLRALFATLASTLSGRPVSFTLVERQQLEDLNGANACFTARWRDGPITWSERVICGSGNPRDGYGYDLEFILSLPTRTLQVHTGGWEPVPESIDLEVNSTAREWLTLREALRKELGAERDQCFAPRIAANALGELTRQGEHAAALALAREALERAKPHDPARAELVTWLATNDSSAGGTPMRVKEAPAQLDGWLELEQSGDGSLAQTFARLCPFELKRWKAAGLPVAPWFDHPLWPFARETAPEGTWHTVHFRPGVIGPALPSSLGKALTRWESGTHWEDHGGESIPGVDGWRWEVSRRARYPEGSKVPVVHVTLLGARREPHEWELPPLEQYGREYRELMKWSWIAGFETGDVVLIGERSLPLRGRSPETAAITFTALGSNEFRARAEAVVTKSTHLKWYPVSRSESLEPWRRPAPAFTDVDGALRATLGADELARARQLMQCRCEERFCEHRLELRRTSQAHRFSHHPAERARGQAWAAAEAMTASPPQPETAAERVRDANEELLHAAEFVE